MLWAGVYLWALGYPDQAKQAVLDQLELSRRLNHAFNLCWSLTGGTLTLVLLGETQLAYRWNAEATAIAREHAMNYMVHMMVPWMDGMARVDQGDYAQGYSQVTASLKVWRAAGALFNVPWAYVSRATALLGLKRFDEARALLDEATEIVNRTGHRSTKPRSTA